MKKIELQVTKQNDTTVRFKIKTQTHRGFDFGNDASFGDQFRASNNTRLVSLDRPEIMEYTELLVFCMRGDDAKCDRRTVVASPKTFKRIEQAIAEYNEHFKGE